MLVKPEVLNYVSVADDPRSILRSSPFWRYAVAVLCVLIATGVRLAVDPLIGRGLPLFAFTIAIMAATQIAGRGPGLLATGLSIPLAGYFFIEPRFSATIADRSGVWSLVILGVIGIGISLLSRRPQSAFPRTREVLSDRSFLWRTALFGTAFLILVLLTRMLYSDLATEKQRQQWVTHSYQVINAIQALRSNLQDAETGQRGYLLTGDEKYLVLFESAVREEPSLQLDLRQLTADDPSQQERLDKVDRLVIAKFAELESSITMRRKKGADAAVALVRTGDGKQLMDESRALLRALEEEDRRLLFERAQAAEVQGVRVRWVLGLGSGSLLLLLAFAGAVIDSDSRKSERARQRLHRSEQRLSLALDSANAGTWEWDLNTNENIWSDELWKLCGIEPHSCVPSYDSWRTIVHPDDLPNVLQTLAQAARTESELAFEFRMRDCGGDERWLMARGRPTSDDQGRAVSLIGIVLDITEQRKAEERLRASEDQFRTMANAMPQLAWMASPDGWIFWYNQGWYDYTGTTPQQMEGWGWQSVHDAAALPKVMERWRASIATSEPFDMVYPLRSGRGEYRAFLARVSPIKNSSGEVLRWFGTNTDVEEQKRAEEALRLSEERFRVALKNSRVAVFNLDRDLRYTWIYNPQLVRETSAYIGRTVSEFFGPEEGEAIAQIRRGVLETGRGVREEVRTTIDGREHYFDTTIEPAFDATGAVIGLTGAGTDITELKQAEYALRVSEERLRLAVRAAAMGIWELQLPARLLTWSPEVFEIFGVPASAPPRFEDTTRFTHPEDRSLVEEQSVLLLAGKPIHFDYRIIRPDGEVRWIEVSSKAEFDDAGQPVRCLGVCQDVTERYQLEAQFRQVQKMEAVGQLAGGVAHEFNNMLTIIIGYGDLLRDKLQDDERQRGMIEGILKAARRAALVTQQLLAFSRKQILMPTVLDLNSILEDLGKMLAHLIGEDIDLNIVCGHGLGRVMADASQIQQVIMNLVVNARDAMPYGGKLTLETANAEWDEMSAQKSGIEAKAGSFVLLSVADTGIGMDRETQTHIFEPFFTTKDVGKGTGLGLSIVYGIVQQSGGFVWVRSEPGQGTTFKIHLPRVKEEEINISATQVLPKSRRGSETILLVEDEQGVRDAIFEFLEGQGYTVLQAHNSRVAIEIAQEHGNRIHLLITDIIMPEMSGQELAKQLRANRPEMSVLFISGYTDREIRGGTTIDANVDFLQKPFAFDVLGRKLRDILER
ncbi:MAG: PAS domain-containing protein [Candidatus Korobacteraceae bacterium]